MRPVPFLDTSAGRLAYSRAGRGPAVLLIQGAGVVGNGWSPQVSGLSHRFDLIAFDNRGIGASDRGPGPLAIEAMAEDALALMAHEGIERFHVAGHSMGGLIAQPGRSTPCWPSTGTAWRMSAD
jgi:pimeloyl-ACP methyl ester carboxylesterase